MAPKVLVVLARRHLVGPAILSPLTELSFTNFTMKDVPSAKNLLTSVFLDVQFNFMYTVTWRSRGDEHRFRPIFLARDNKSQLGSKWRRRHRPPLTSSGESSSSSFHSN